MIVWEWGRRGIGEWGGISGIPGAALDVGDVHAEVIGVGCSVGIGFSC